ncbi:glycosyltransferase family 4 protein [Parapedobacter deserti]|uniref:Glycosyltransferase family 4 protein n=1 Tax=Parapedobacter deserti TaxID=1912957 RepID=A0ABV7JRR6_9SPHI
MRVSIAHPTGNANVRNAVEGLLQAGLLGSFYTTIALFPGTLAYGISGVGPLKEFRKRTYAAALKPYTQAYPANELCRLLSEKAKLTSFVKHENGRFCIDRIYHALDKKVARNTKAFDAIYAYEDGALASFQAAKPNIRCLYDLPIGYWRAMHQLLAAERINRPEWSATLTGLKDSDRKLRRKDAELALADHIFVASTFTKSSLALYPGKLPPIDVIPYGFPEIANGKPYSILSGQKLKLLFVGGLSQRKGIANVLEAVDYLKPYVELTIVGRKTAEKCVPLEAGLQQHRWIPSLPHRDVIALMREHDVLVFPSLFEGFGLVITEAMSQGTPVITTHRTAGPDLITHDDNGWLVDAGSTPALIAQIERLLSNPMMIKANGLAALESARKRPWPVYGRELAEKIKEVTVTG